MATKSRAARATRERRGFWRDNALSIVLAVAFVVLLVAQAVAGHRADNAEREQHGRPPQSLQQYLASGAFASATFENWESEFLQMGLYVLLTVWLRQRGSAESRPMSEQEEEDIEKTERKYWIGPTPRLAKARGVARWLYANSLSLALFALFAISFVGHLIGSWRDHVEEQLAHGAAPPTLAEHVADAQFWFESFQNWQSEFLAVLVLVVLSIWLRQDKSTQSKAVEAPHAATGS
jgi:hypothetical protein